MACRFLFPVFTLFILLLVSCATTPNPRLQRIKRGNDNAFVSLWLPLATERALTAYHHSILDSHRGASDCSPNCPQIDIWQYQYRPDGVKTLTDKKPMATKKAFWKVKDEARIISISMFNDNRIYFNGFKDYLKSFAHIKAVNKIEDSKWGYETFTVRVYVAKRNPEKLLALGALENETSDDMIEQFLALGCEVAFVDNELCETGKDGTFWRFMIAGEEMPEGQRIRYLVRDADQILTAGEAFSVGEWIASGFQYHRMHLIPVCFGPLTAMVIGGSHTGKGPFPDIKTIMSYYPYRIRYGDDELFTRDMMWPRMKATGSVMTHHYERDYRYFLANPYQGSCEEPTQQYCDAMRPGGHCPDVLMPDDVYTPLGAVGLRSTLEDLKVHPEYFDLRRETERGRAAIEALKAH